MKILVLGGAGYIGSHTVYKLIEEGHDVVVADNLQTGHIEAVHPKARFYEGDIRDRAFLDELFTKENADINDAGDAGSKIDGIIHFAANSLVAESMRAPLDYYENNLYGTMVLLGAMVDHGIDKLVFSSTAAVYGEPENIPILETDRTEPTNVYGETKLAMEKMIGWTAKAHGLKYVALRYFNACGALDIETRDVMTKDGSPFAIGEAHDPETHLIPLVLQVPNGKRDSIHIFGADYPTEDGTCVRDYIHVTDLAAAHILAMEHLAAGGQSDVFNLGNGRGFSVAEIVERACQVTGYPIISEIKPRREGDPAILIASNDKACSVLGWQPEYTDIEDIIRTAWKWHEKQKY